MVNGPSKVSKCERQDTPESILPILSSCPRCIEQGSVFWVHTYISILISLHLARVVTLKSRLPSIPSGMDVDSFEDSQWGAASPTLAIPATSASQEYSPGVVLSPWDGREEEAAKQVPSILRSGHVVVRSVRHAAVAAGPHVPPPSAPPPQALPQLTRRRKSPPQPAVDGGTGRAAAGKAPRKRRGRPPSRRNKRYPDTLLLPPLLESAGPAAESVDLAYQGADALLGLLQSTADQPVAEEPAAAAAPASPPAAVDVGVTLLMQGSPLPRRQALELTVVEESPLEQRLAAKRPRLETAASDAAPQPEVLSWQAAEGGLDVVLGLKGVRYAGYLRQVTRSLSVSDGRKKNTCGVLLPCIPTSFLLLAESISAQGDSSSVAGCHRNARAGPISSHLGKAPWTRSPPCPGAASAMLQQSFHQPQPRGVGNWRVWGRSV